MEDQVKCPACNSYNTQSFKWGAIKFGFGCIISPFIISYLISINYILKYFVIGIGVLCV